jgi:O-antigen/teichoic acid export membrane protein
LWAGAGYEDAYIIALLFFIPLTVPLIQNLGITILQARNQMKFRSLLYIFIAVGSLGISIPLTKYYGGIGCAIGTATALTLGQIIIMNIYYRRKQALDILTFWCEIFKMSIAPLIICVLSYIALQNYSITSWTSFAIASILFSVIYLTTLFRFSMNSSERDLFVKPIKKIIKR